MALEKFGENIDIRRLNNEYPDSESPLHIAEGVELTLEEWHAMVEWLELLGKENQWDNYAEYAVELRMLWPGRKLPYTIPDLELTELINSNNSSAAALYPERFPQNYRESRKKALASEYNQTFVFRIYFSDILRDTCLLFPDQLDHFRTEKVKVAIKNNLDFFKNAKSEFEKRGTEPWLKNLLWSKLFLQNEFPNELLGEEFWKAMTATLNNLKDAVRTNKTPAQRLTNVLLTWKALTASEIKTDRKGIHIIGNKSEHQESSTYPLPIVTNF